VAKWSRLHEQKRQRILELLDREARPFEDLSDEARDARRALPFFEWCRTYLPHYFGAPFTPAHERMVEAVGEPGMPTFVCAFRGFGKSVILALARPLWRTLQRSVPYWLYGAAVRDLAAQNMDYVRIELEHNPRIRCDYGEALRCDGDEGDWLVELGARQRGDDGRWALQHCKFEAFGIGMSPRGRRSGPHRPLEFVGDDLEHAELARNPRREQQLWDWLMDGVYPALEPKIFRFTVLGTMFGPDCMLERARRTAEKTDDTGRPLARYFRRSALDESGASVWPERFPDEELSRTRAVQGLRNWNRNFALTADDPSKPFQPDWFGRRYKKRELDPDQLDRVAFLDPAISEAPTGCPRALVVIGCDRKTGERYVLDAWISRGSPSEMVDRLFRCQTQHRPRAIGIEGNGGYALIRPLLEIEEERRRLRIPARYVHHSRPKDLRIESLCPEMETGRWLWPEHPHEGMKTLIDQFLSYPDGFADGPDATAGCTEMLPGAYRPASTDVGYKSLRKRRDLSGVL